MPAALWEGEAPEAKKRELKEMDELVVTRFKPEAT